MRNIIAGLLKFIGALLLILLLVVVGVVVARDGIVNYAAQKIVAAKTGFGLAVQGLHIALLQPGLEINDLKLTNPTDFPEPGALEIKKLKVSLDRAGTSAQEIRLREVTLDLPSVVVVKKVNGEINFQRLAGWKAEQPKPTETPAPQPQPQAPAEPKHPAKKLLIDRLALRLGTIYVRTYAQGEDQPREQKYVMNIERSFENVANADFKVIGTQLFLEAMLKSSPDALLNLGGGVMNAGQDLGGAAGDGVKQVGGTVQDVGQQLGNALQGLLHGGKK